MQLSWTPPGGVKATIPMTALYPSIQAPKKAFVSDFTSAGRQSLFIDQNGVRVDDATLVVNRSGKDFTIYEHDDGLVEFGKIDVLVSQDGSTWVSVKSSEGSPIRIAGDEGFADNSFARSYDLGSLSSARYIRITGTDSSSGGFDLDAIGIIHPGANAPAFPTILANTTGDNLLAVIGAPNSRAIVPDAQKSIGLSNNRTVTFAGFAPSLIPVQEVRVIPGCALRTSTRLEREAMTA